VYLLHWKLLQYYFELKMLWIASPKNLVGISKILGISFYDAQSLLRSPGFDLTCFLLFSVVCAIILTLVLRYGAAGLHRIRCGLKGQKGG
jgi:hypothetical protein